MAGEDGKLGVAERTTLQSLARDQLPGLYALARHLDARRAEDLVQDTLVRACRCWDTLEDPAAAPRWLRVVMVNLWRDRLRHDGRRPRQVSVDCAEGFSLYRTLADEDPLPWSDTLHVDFLGALSTEDVHLVLARLPEHFRVALVLRYVEGFGAGEIAELLDQPPGTVYSHLHRGRERFERELWEYAEESGLLDDHPGRTRPAVAEVAR